LIHIVLTLSVLNSSIRWVFSIMSIVKTNLRNQKEDNFKITEIFTLRIISIWTLCPPIRNCHIKVITQVVSLWCLCPTEETKKPKLLAWNGKLTCEGLKIQIHKENVRYLYFLGHSVHYLNTCWEKYWPSRTYGPTREIGPLWSARPGPNIEGSWSTRAR
jgi:hypothetical protein